MANITAEERARRAAEKAAQEGQNKQPEQPTPPNPDNVHTDPNQDVDIVPPSTYRTPAPVEEPKERGVYDVDQRELEHFKVHKLAEEKQKSLDAIEQAVRDACKITEDKIRKDPVVMALADDPADVGKRIEFLRKFGPSNVKPPKPEPTPFGIKDEALMEWTARYEPENFIKVYGEGKSEIVKRLMAQIRKAS